MKWYRLREFWDRTSAPITAIEVVKETMHTLDIKEQGRITRVRKIGSMTRYFPTFEACRSFYIKRYSDRILHHENAAEHARNRRTELENAKEGK